MSINPHIRIKKNKRARRLALRLDVKERVINLVVPPGVSLKKAEKFAREHEGWIQDKINELPPPVPYEHGRTIPLFSQNTRLNITCDSTLKRTSIKRIDKELIVRTNKGDPAPRIERFLKNLAKETLSEMSHDKAALIGKKIKNIQVRDTKSRWGSCAHDGGISFSWRLILAPYEAMDYVVAHEVAHLKHLNHSKAFWNVCKELSDDFMEGKYWMHNHGHELMRYGQSSVVRGHN